MEGWQKYLDILWDRGRRSFDDLTQPEKEQLAGHLLDSCNFTDAWDRVYVPTMPSQISHFMVNDDPELLRKLVNEITETVVHNHQAQILVLFENLRKSKHDE